VHAPELPADIIRKLRRYPLIPAMLLGRLAVDQRYRGLGYGRFLLADALFRAVRSEIASFAVVVQAKDEAARRFYERESFLPFPDSADDVVQVNGGHSEIVWIDRAASDFRFLPGGRLAAIHQRRLKLVGHVCGTGTNVMVGASRGAIGRRRRVGSGRIRRHSIRGALPAGSDMEQLEICADMGGFRVSGMGLRAPLTNST
jgi:hypothetical protein